MSKERMKVAWDSQFQEWFSSAMSSGDDIWRRAAIDIKRQFFDPNNWNGNTVSLDSWTPYVNLCGSETEAEKYFERVAVV